MHPLKPITLLIIFFLTALSQISHAQDKAKVNTANLLLKLSYGINFPASDLSDRFGTYFSPGLQLDYVLNSGLTFGLTYQFHFGSTVKEDVLQNLRDDQSIIIGTNNVIADVFLRQRGFAIIPQVGYLWPLGKLGSSSNIHGLLGLGLWQHKIRILDDQNSVPQVRNQFVPGYDRLSNGFALTQTFGYTHISTRNATRFFIQVEFMEGIIKNRRDWDITLMRKLDESRFDISYGFRIGWILPIIEGRRKNGDIFY